MEDEDLIFHDHVADIFVRERNILPGYSVINVSFIKCIHTLATIHMHLQVYIQVCVVLKCKLCPVQYSFPNDKFNLPTLSLSLHSETIVEYMLKLCSAFPCNVTTISMVTIVLYVSWF